MKHLKSLIICIFAATTLSLSAFELTPLQGINGMWGYQNVSGVMVIKPKYDQARPFHEGLAAVCRDGKWGFINQQGRITVKLIYQACENYLNGYAVVKRDGKWGAVNSNGVEEVPCRFESPADLQNLIVITNGSEKTIMKADE